MYDEPDTESDNSGGEEDEETEDGDDTEEDIDQDFL